MPTFAFLTPAPAKSDVARVRLLAAALDIFGDQGPRGATVRDIASAAGQNVAAIAYYFGSKEALYNEIIEGVVLELRGRVGDVLEEIQALRESGPASPREARRLLQKFFRTVYLRLLSRNEAVAIGRIIVREQLTPSASFEILYAKGFRALHEALCYLVGVILDLGADDPETIIRTHMVMGQIYFFTMTREAILRRMGWTDLEGEKAEWVAGLLAEHIDALLDGLTRQKHKRRAKRSSSKEKR
jgi:TetR/AcrR family transcriptional regulator, regulator of cefoperazone and chloramphenicol sensitivity